MTDRRDLLVGHGVVITFDEVQPIIDDGAVLVQEGVIAAIGATAALRAAHPTAEYLDARGCLIMPGLICAHTHTYGAFARGMALKDPPPTNFVEILQRLWWRLDRALRPEDIEYSALACLLDAITYGTTTLVDHHASPYACSGSLSVIAQAFIQAGVRGILCYEVSDRDGHSKAQEGLQENERFLASLPRGDGQTPPLLGAMIGLHASFTLSDETLRQAADLARQHHRGVHIHVAEDKADQEDSLRRSGRRVVHRLADLDVLVPHSIAAHCVHCDASELALLRDRHVFVVHNPRSNMNNAVGTADVPAMLALGLQVGLGNDGFTNDMFQEMKAAYLVQKALRGDPQALTAPQVLHLAITTNGVIADALFGLPETGPRRFGRLAVGSPGDLIVVDYPSPTPLTASNLPWHIIFGMGGHMVTTTIVNGRILMRDREIMTLDREAITARSRELARALWQRL